MKAFLPILALLLVLWYFLKGKATGQPGSGFGASQGAGASGGGLSSGSQGSAAGGKITVNTPATKVGVSGGGGGGIAAGMSAALPIGKAVSDLAGALSDLFKSNPGPIDQSKAAALNEKVFSEAQQQFAMDQYFQLHGKTLTDQNTPGFAETPQWFDNTSALENQRMIDQASNPQNAFDWLFNPEDNSMPWSYDKSPDLFNSPYDFNPTSQVYQGEPNYGLVDMSNLFNNSYDSGGAPDFSGYQWDAGTSDYSVPAAPNFGGSGTGVVGGYDFTPSYPSPGTGDLYQNSYDGGSGSDYAGGDFSGYG